MFYFFVFVLTNKKKLIKKKMNVFINLLMLILLLMNIKLLKCVLCFDVKFRAVYDVEIEPYNTEVYKREMIQFFDKASYSFNGFNKIESVPVLFPIDICILKLEGIKYAASLHKKADGSKHFAVYKMNNGTYQQLADLSTPNAIAMDCGGLGAKGFIAVAYNFPTPVENALEGSPIFELSGNRVRAIQYFAAANLVNVYLRVQGNDVMLLQTFKNTKSTPNLHCPFFKWSGSTFNRVGRIPCSNARHLEPFSIDYENYVAVANYADQRGRTSTNSEIYKFMREKNKFQLFQKIKTNGAVDVRYFSVPVDEVRRQHFLIFGNSLSHSNNLSGDDEKGYNREADSIIYVFDKGQFVPYQRLTFYAVEQFLPIQNVDAEKFLLLVSSTNQDIKIYNLNDWKFEESKAQFTAGALGKGVARMRTFQEQEETYLVIANEKMAANETNIFLPIYKQEEHANALRQQIIDWAKENMARLKTLDVERLKSNVERKLQKPYSTMSLELTDIPNGRIENVITESLTNHRLHMDSNYWKALNYAQRALGVLANEDKSHHMHKRDLSLTLPDSYDFETIKVDTLVVRNTLEAQKVNGVQSELPEFDQIRSKKIVVTGNYFAPLMKSTYSSNLTIDDAISTLDVGNLITTGKINGWSWHVLLNNTLKREGFQFIKSPASFKSLSTKTIAATNEKINNISLAKLVPINGGNYVVAQQVQFDSPITAKNVLINERLNQIHVLHQNFHALLKNSNKTQVITGLKRLNSVRLLNPITLAGSMSSNHLRAISPNKAIHNDLVLQGDFMINGDVFVSKMLATPDLWDQKSNGSLQTKLINGLRIDIPLENVKLKFNSSAMANNTVVRFVNTKDMQHLLKSNTSVKQLVEGLKIFKNDLKIENGLNDAKWINGINTENLAKELLLKNSDQTIIAPIHFGRILAKGLQAQNLTMQNKSLTDFLSKSGKQQITGNLKVDKLQVQSLTSQNLNTNGKIFDKPLSEFYQQKHKTSRNTNIFQTTSKINGTIYVKNLVLSASLNGKSVTTLERQLQQLVGNVKYVGNYNFNYEMSIQNLTFHEQLNGIAARDFGKCWLQKTGNQVFTAPQTFASAKFNKGSILKGRINGVDLRDFYEQTFWIDRDEYINNAKFLNPIELQKSLNTKTLKDLNVPKDFLYRNSIDPQILKSEIMLEKSLQVDGSILNATSLNELDMNLLKEYLYRVTNRNTLFVKNANFSYAPKYQTLNKYDLQQLLETIWLSNENVALRHHVEISEANFEGLLDLEGPINNMNLEYLKENYLSRSKPQTILTEVIFMKQTNFQSINTNEINLMGPLTEAVSKLKINFDEFVSNSLKTSGHHEVRNNWTLSEAAISGSLKDISINELNFVQDIVRLDADNLITAEKRVRAAALIERLYTVKKSTLINGINIANWFECAVYLNRNQTISGVTTLDNANIVNLYVAGNLNTKKFNKDTLWLRDQSQHVPAKVLIRNKLGKQGLILVNNINNLDVSSINNRNVINFLIGTERSSQVESNLIFEQPLVVDEYSSSNAKTDDPKFKRQTSEIANDWFGLQKALNILQKSVIEREFVLKDFKLKQKLRVNASEFIFLPLLMNGEILNLIGFINDTNTETSKQLTFYHWSNQCDCFLPYNEAFSWLSRDPETLKALKLLFGATDFIKVNEIEHGQLFGNITVTSNGVKELLNLQSKSFQNLKPFKLQNKDCFMFFGDIVGNSKVQIYCLDINEKNPLMKFDLESELERNIQQMVMLSDHFIALLIGETVEIWNTEAGLKFQKRFIVPSGSRQIAASRKNGVTFLAIATASKSYNYLPEAVEIYSFEKGSDFQHQQTIVSDSVVEQIELHVSNESQDLLLLIRTKMNNKSLLIYQHQGVKGFQLVFAGGPSNVPRQMQLLYLKNIKKHFAILFTESGIDIVEIVLNKI